MPSMRKADLTSGFQRLLRSRVLLMLLLLAIFVFTLPPLLGLVGRSVAPQEAVSIFPPVSPDLYSPKLHVGNMEGVPLAIPSNLLEFAVEYMDKSAWEPKGKGYYESKTFADPIRNFALYLRWPDLAGRTPETEQSFMQSHTGFGPKDWIGVAVINDYAHNPRPPQTPQNGPARELEGSLSKLSEEWRTQHPIKIWQRSSGEDILVKDARYELIEHESVTGLHAAIPAGADTKWWFIENDALYWEGDRTKEVSVLIRCPHGVAINNPPAVFKCSHKYILPELGAYVTLRYTRNLLPQWRAMQEKTRHFVLSLRTQPR